MSKFRNYDNYDVFEDGRIWSYKTNRFLKPAITHNGYQRVMLYDNEGKRKTYLVHRIVWESFTGKQIPPGMQINHRNEIKTDNRFFENLELMTPKENINYGTGIARRTKSFSKTMTNNPKRSKQVCAYKNDELVMTFPSAREAHRQGFECGAVSKCCNGKMKTYKGFTWKYI